MNASSNELERIVTNGELSMILLHYLVMCQGLSLKICKGWFQRFVLGGG